jgi:hypothetical protein
LGGLARKEGIVKTINFDYDEIGHICLVDKADMDRLFAELPKLGIKVKTVRPTPRAADSWKAGDFGSPKKNKKKVSRPAKSR